MVPQSRKHSPITIGLLWQINALLICIMHKPWAVCKRTPEPLSWYTVSLGQVSPHLPREERIALLVANGKNTVVKQLGKTPLFDNDAASGCFKTRRSWTCSLSSPSFCKICWENWFCILSHRNACPVTKLFLLFLLQNHTMTQHSS